MRAPLDAKVDDRSAVAPIASTGVSSGHPLATQAGLAAFAAGGSAVDAALAAAFTQWVVSPTVCGPGGDLFVLHVSGGRSVTYGGWARTPGRLDPGAPLPATGPGSVVVPGALPGAEAAWAAVGRLPWRSLFDHAIRHSGGHEVTPWMARSYETVLAKGNGAALAGVLDDVDGKSAPVAGQWVSTRRLGSTLAQVAREGPTVFHLGALAEQIVDAAARDGALLTLDDLAASEAEVHLAHTTELGDCTITVPGWPSQAGITAELLSAVDPGIDPTDVAFCEALAPLTRDLLIARCVVGLSGTAVSSAVDGDDAAIVVHSLAGVQFGSGWVAGDTGVALGNRVGTALSTRADLPAANPVPGEVVPHTLSAAYFEGGGRRALVATPGGDRQVQWLAQAGQRFRNGAGAQEMVTGPRWFVCPEGDRFGVPGGIGRDWYLFAEPGVQWRTEPRLSEFAVKQVEWVGGGLQAIVHDADDITLATDPRGGGDAAMTGVTDV